MTGSNYVKCVRGSRAAYDSLPVKDKNALYFIFEDSDNSSALYLGSELIAYNGANSLDELRNVLVSTLADKDFLTYDKTTSQWKNISLSTLALDI